jgi:hypothetical protein
MAKSILRGIEAAALLKILPEYYGPTTYAGYSDDYISLTAPKSKRKTGKSRPYSIF